MKRLLLSLFILGSLSAYASQFPKMPGPKEAEKILKDHPEACRILLLYKNFESVSKKHKVIGAGVVTGLGLSTHLPMVGVPILAGSLIAGTVTEFSREPYGKSWAILMEARGLVDFRNEYPTPKDIPAGTWEEFEYIVFGSIWVKNEQMFNPKFGLYPPKVFKKFMNKVERKTGIIKETDVKNILHQGLMQGHFCQDGIYAKPKDLLKYVEDNLRN